jgi:hypothetical protein
LSFQVHAFPRADDLPIGHKARDLPRVAVAGRETESPMTHESATTAQLRHDIDSGRTGSKVNFPDPAAAPLGTDDEAAGTPPSAESVSLARRQEAARPETGPRANPGGLDVGVVIYTVILGVIVATLAAMAVWMSV